MEDKLRLVLLPTTVTCFPNYFETFVQSILPAIGCKVDTLKYIWKCGNNICLKVNMYKTVSAMYLRTVHLELVLKIYDATYRTYVNAECKRNPKWKIYITDSIHNFPGYAMYLYFISKAEENIGNNINSKSFIVYFIHRYIHRYLHSIEDINNPNQLWPVTVT